MGFPWGYTISVAFSWSKFRYLIIFKAWKLYLISLEMGSRFWFRSQMETLVPDPCPLIRKCPRGNLSSLTSNPIRILKILAVLGSGSILNLKIPEFWMWSRSGFWSLEFCVTGDWIWGSPWSASQVPWAWLYWRGLTRSGTSAPVATSAPVRLLCVAEKLRSGVAWLMMIMMIIVILNLRSAESLNFFTPMAKLWIRKNAR